MGCVLNFTTNDFRQISRSLHAQTAGANLSKAERDQIRKTLHNSSRNQLISILGKPDSPAYKAVSQLLMGTMVGQMSNTERDALPAAFYTILKHTPDAMGLFLKAPSHRGPGSSPVQHHYEILATACLIDKHCKSKSGKLLYIDATDRVDFGLKFSRGYAQPRRFGTIEADMLVSRGTINPLGPDFGKTVAIDAKYSSGGKYTKKPGLQRQLDGIRNGFLDGKIQEFYFVTNKEFAQNFKAAVKEENLLIAREFASQNNSVYNSVPHGYLTQQEQKNHPALKLPADFFTEFNEDVTGFIAKHDIPQIDMCEYVEYAGS